MASAAGCNVRAREWRDIARADIAGIPSDLDDRRDRAR
jgi:hypothetical protein